MNLIVKDYREYVQEMEHKEVCIVDPPWGYKDRNPRVKKQLSYSLWKNNDEELDFLFKNIKCNYLFVWVTNSFMLNIMKVNHYEYEYKCLITWLKLTKNGRDFYGLGNSFRNCTEQLILFNKKKCKALHLSERNIIKERASKNTQKPKQFEYLLLSSLQKKGLNKFCYIFCGTNITKFEEFNIDLIDIRLNDFKKIEAEKLFI